MLKAVIGENVILGLSRENVERLQTGDFILFEGDPIGFPGKTFFILFGETEKLIMEQLMETLNTPPTSH